MPDERDYDAKSELRDVVAALLALVLPAEQRELIARLTNMVCACKGIAKHRLKRISGHWVGCARGAPMPGHAALFFRA